MIDINSVASASFIQEEAERVKNLLFEVIDCDNSEAGIWRAVMRVVDGEPPVHISESDLRCQLEGIKLFLIETENYEEIIKLESNFSKVMTKDPEKLSTKSHLIKS